MTQYIRAELYRLNHKRSSKIYYGSWILLFTFITIVTSAFDSSYQLLIEAVDLVPFVALIITTYAFSCVYCDDLSSKTLGAGISAGNSQGMIVVSKLIVLALYTFIIVLIHTLILLGLYFWFGGRFLPVDVKIINSVFTHCVYTFGASLGYASMASVLVYFFRSVPLSIVSYLLLSMGFINELFGLVIRRIQPISDLATMTLTSLADQARLPEPFTSGTLFIAVLLLCTLSSGFIATYALKHKDL